MEERNKGNAGDHGHDACCKGGVAPLIVGFVAAIVVGWWFFPKMLYSEKTQPIVFSHKVHIEDAGMACEDCHYFREDGSYAGLPTTEDCAGCHADAMGENPEELKFISNYVHEEKEVAWLRYQTQPDNVFFSHAVHKMDKCGECHDFSEAELCNNCHPAVAESDTPPVYKENRLNKYSKDTMKMWKCEACHSIPEHREMTNANNACFTCHK